MILVPRGSVNSNLVVLSTMTFGMFRSSSETVLMVYKKIDSFVLRINE